MVPRGPLGDLDAYFWKTIKMALDGGAKSCPTSYFLCQLLSSFYVSKKIYKFGSTWRECVDLKTYLKTVIL